MAKAKGGNPWHDKRGRFTHRGAGGGAATAAPKLATGPKPKPGTLVKLGKNEVGRLEGYNKTGEYYEVRRFRNGKPAKSTSWYQGTPVPAKSQTPPKPKPPKGNTLDNAMKTTTGEGTWAKTGRGKGTNAYVFTVPGKDSTADESFGAAYDPGVDQGGKFGGSTREWVVIRWPAGTEPGSQEGENVDTAPTLQEAKAKAERLARETARPAPSADQEAKADAYHREQSTETLRLWARRGDKRAQRILAERGG